MENTITNPVNRVVKKSYLNDFATLATAANENAKNKGFWNEPRTKTRAYALIIGEVYEAYDAFRANFINPELKNYYQHLEFVAAFNGDGLPDPGNDFNNAPAEVKAKAVKEAYEKVIKGSVAEELGDVVIRLGDTAKGYNLSFIEIENGAAVYEAEILNYKAANEPEEIDELILELNDLLLATRGQSTILSQESYFLGQALRLVYYIAERLQIDVDLHIDLKAAYNRGRAFKHGKAF